MAGQGVKIIYRIGRNGLQECNPVILSDAAHSSPSKCLACCVMGAVQVDAAQFNIGDWVNSGVFRLYFV
jgi:hypothetical protein